MILFNECPVSWATSRQKSVALSTSEAETYAMTTCLKETIYLDELVSFLLGSQKDTERSRTCIYTDNNQVLSCIKDGATSRTKHYSVKWAFIKSQTSRFYIKRISTNDNIADLMTKGLSGTRTETLQSAFHQK